MKQATLPAHMLLMGAASKNQGWGANGMDRH